MPARAQMIRLCRRLLGFTRVTRRNTMQRRGNGRGSMRCDRRIAVGAGLSWRAPVGSWRGSSCQGEDVVARFVGANGKGGGGGRTPCPRRQGGHSHHRMKFSFYNPCTNHRRLAPPIKRARRAHARDRKGGDAPRGVESPARLVSCCRQARLARHRQHTWRPAPTRALPTPRRACPWG